MSNANLQYAYQSRKFIPQKNKLFLSWYITMTHRAPGSNPPLVGLTTWQVPGAGVWWGRRSWITGAGRALRHSTVLLGGRTIVWVTLTRVHFLVTEVDAQHLSCRLSLAAGYRALTAQTHRVGEEMHVDTNPTAIKEKLLWFLLSLYLLYHSSPK